MPRYHTYKKARNPSSLPMIVRYTYDRVLIRALRIATPPPELTMTEQTIKTRILIISDTHCAPLKPKNSDSPPPFAAPLPAADILIHCGDLTHTGQAGQYNQALDMLKEIQAPVKLVIAGNHDLTLDKEFMLNRQDLDGRLGEGMTAEKAAAACQKARDLWTAPDGRAKEEGITFLDEGLHQITLPNGARLHLYASPYTPEFYDWGFPYDRDTDRFNPTDNTLTDAKKAVQNPVPAYSTSDLPIDILLTHGPPYGQGDQTDRGDYAGCPHLLLALMRSRPLLHCYGHIHEGWGAQKIRWSERVDEVVATPTTIEDWKNGVWQAGIANNGLESVSVNEEKTLQRRAAFLDVSRDGGLLRRGRETALVNAAIMDVKYRPVNAPWLVDIELPKAS
ncbi:hypothetical protein LTR78_009772 [Recurvomyces mirabilis]|uniref:Calcineurin-like phosphoesterase domain-containing protein n=1 Tax=Recurvomyces mirabilis TaxID=574656 RepID=A0AAE0TN68_9PEZI|nr:hypothetical protein LTR78_009772 [Recurvomyces mirabilis]KAK5158190.1 hypothetical protein LTS14_003208 [Recurvomyces mirabilis]